MVPILVEIGPLVIYSFGAMMALGFLVSGYVVSRGFERLGHDPEHAWSIVLWAAVGGVVGARVVAILSDWQTFLDHPFGSLFSGSGFVWYGGLIGGFVSVTIYVLRNGIAWLDAVDAVAPGLALGQAIGRIGCQISGDGDWGKPSDLPWAVAYPNSIIGWQSWVRANGLPPDVRVHPAPVYETLAYCAIFVLLWRLKDRGLRKGSLLWVYFVTSSVARFLVEAIRVEPVVAAGLTQAQWIAIALFGIGTVLLAARVGPEAGEPAR